MKKQVTILEDSELCSISGGGAIWLLQQVGDTYILTLQIV